MGEFPGARRIRDEEPTSYFSSPSKIIGHLLYSWSRDISVGITTDYKSPLGEEVYILHIVQMVIGITQPPVQGIKGLFPRR
jgi:hypothetical protein